jgi:hypothetical protein
VREIASYGRIRWVISCNIRTLIAAKFADALAFQFLADLTENAKNQASKKDRQTLTHKD